MDDVIQPTPLSPRRLSGPPYVLPRLRLARPLVPWSLSVLLAYGCISGDGQRALEVQCRLHRSTREAGDSETGPLVLGADSVDRPASGGELVRSGHRPASGRRAGGGEGTEVTGRPWGHVGRARGSLAAPGDMVRGHGGHWPPQGTWCESTEVTGRPWGHCVRARRLLATPGGMVGAGGHRGY